MKRLLSMYEKVRHHETVVIYVDESHFHRDLEIGYTWGPIGERIWRTSDCPPLAERINWFGAYNFSDGQCMIWAEGACNQLSTAQFLRQINQWVQKQGRQLVVIWDGAPWHRAQSVLSGLTPPSKNPHRNGPARHGSGKHAGSDKPAC